MQANFDRGEERRRPSAKRVMLIGVDFAQGGVRDQTGVCLVGKCGPELVPMIPADGLKAGEPVSFSR